MNELKIRTLHAKCVGWEVCRVSNRSDLGGTVPILTEIPESRLDLGTCPDFETELQRSHRPKDRLYGIFRVILC